ncbi:Hypothetical predicted protein [Paramuricea clavata]|uniref:Uncharacterized protein n=1 Tax=Paramuricea clavata TaxID=317549 RepID=A0A7D9IMN1_PARCT|nr:Hypothetical predicted protein [Paramuricea clavata]
MAYSIRTQKQATTKYTPFFLMFGRNPNSPQMVTVVEDSSPDQLEDLLDEQVGERTALAEDACSQASMYLPEVLSNVEIAQEKPKKQFQKRIAKGVKTFNIKVGDTIFKKQMKNVSRKGGKMEPVWMGGHIDNQERALF